MSRNFVYKLGGELVSIISVVQSIIRKLLDHNFNGNQSQESAGGTICEL